MDVNDNKICDKDDTTTTSVSLAIPTTQMSQVIQKDVVSYSQGSCSDGIKNQGELAIDCGAPCKKCTLDDCLSNCELECSNKGVEVLGVEADCSCFCENPNNPINNLNRDLTEGVTYSSTTIHKVITIPDTSTTILYTPIDTADTTTTTQWISQTRSTTTTTIRSNELTANRVYQVVNRISGINNIGGGSVFAIRIMDTEFNDHDFTIEKSSSGITVNPGNPSNPDFRLYVDQYSFESMETSTDLCAKIKELKTQGSFYANKYKNDFELIFVYNSIRNCIGL